MRRIAWTLAALTIVAMAPTSAAARTRTPPTFIFEVNRAKVDVQVAFAGDPATCTAHGVCGYAGTLHYVFHTTTGYAFAGFPGGGTPGGAFGFLEGRGTTTADVAVDGGTGTLPHCTDTISVTEDGFGAALRGRRTTVSLHQDPASIFSSGKPPPGSTPGFADTLRTHCAGPSDADIAASHATPSRRYAVSRFRRPRFDLVFSGRRPFRAGGFQGTTRFRARFRLVREGTSAISPGDNTITITQLPPKGSQFG